MNIDNNKNDEEYKDAYFVINYKTNNISNISNIFNKNEDNIERTDTLRLTQEFNESFFKYTKKYIEITPFSRMVDDIKNYRPLTDLQIKELETFTNDEKYKIIKIYNNMFSTLKDFIN
jgi:hypothetical protein